MDIRLRLKSEFKNFISDGLKIYYSQKRPVVEIWNFLSTDIKQTSNIWDEDNRFLTSSKKIPKQILNDYELKEFDFNIMDFKDDKYIIINYEVLFDMCSIDLKEFLDKCKVEMKHVTPLYNNWITVQDLLDVTNKLIKDYFNR